MSDNKKYYLDLDTTIIEFDKNEIMALNELCTHDGWMVFQKLLNAVNKAMIEHSISSIRDYPNFLRFQGFYGFLHSLLRLEQIVKKTLDTEKEK